MTNKYVVVLGSDFESGASASSATSALPRRSAAWVETDPLLRRIAPASPRVNHFLPLSAQSRDVTFLPKQTRPVLSNQNIVTLLLQRVLSPLSPRNTTLVYPKQRAPELSNQDIVTLLLRAVELPLSTPSRDVRFLPKQTCPVLSNEDIVTLPLQPVPLPLSTPSRDVRFLPKQTCPVLSNEDIVTLPLQPVLSHLSPRNRMSIYPKQGCSILSCLSRHRHLSLSLYIYAPSPFSPKVACTAFSRGDRRARLPGARAISH